MTDSNESIRIISNGLAQHPDHDARMAHLSKQIPSDPTGKVDKEATDVERKTSGIDPK